MRLRTACSQFWFAALFCLAAVIHGACAQDAVLTLTPQPVLSTIAGSGHPGYAGDGSAAEASRLASPSAVTYDKAGNLYIADTRNHVIRRVSSAGTISTFAGTGHQGFAGDGGAALAAMLDSPLGLAIAADGSVYFADSHNQRIRKIALDGTISTVAGSGTAGFAGDGGPAVQAALRNPSGLAMGLAGELYIADSGNHRVRRVARDGTIATVAGNGVEGAAGDGGPATSASLDAPAGVAVRADGALLIADRLNSRVRVVTSDGRISSLMQNSLPLRRPGNVAVNAQGDILIADAKNFRVQQVSDSTAGVVLGSGEQGPFNSSAGAPQTPLGLPYGLAADTAGGFAVSDRDNAEIQHVSLGALAFADTPVGLQSPLKQVLLRNGSAVALNLKAVTLPAGFVRDSSSTCGSPPLQLGPGTSCTLAIAFAPQQEAAQSGLLVAGAMGGLPQRILLSGNGLRSGTALPTTTTLRSTGSISYAGVPLTLSATILGSGLAMPSGTVVFYDAGIQIGSAPVTVGAAQITTASLSVGQHSLTASYNGDVNSAASSSPSLAETVAPAPDFAWSADANRLAMQAGTVGVMSLTLQPVNGTLNQTVTLHVDGLPQGATSSLSPAPIVIASNPINMLLTVNVPAGAKLTRVASGLGFVLGMGAFAWRRRSPRLAAGLLCSGIIGLGGCGGGFLSGASTSATAASHTYPMTVTATANGVTGTPIIHTATFTLVVNP